MQRTAKETGSVGSVGWIILVLLPCPPPKKLIKKKKVTQSDLFWFSIKSSSKVTWVTMAACPLHTLCWKSSGPYYLYNRIHFNPLRCQSITAGDVLKQALRKLITSGPQWKTCSARGAALLHVSLIYIIKQIHLDSTYTTPQQQQQQQQVTSMITRSPLVTANVRVKWIKGVHLAGSHSFIQSVWAAKTQTLNWDTFLIWFLLTHFYYIYMLEISDSTSSGLFKDWVGTRLWNKLDHNI